MSQPDIDKELIQGLAALLEEIGLSEIEWEKNGVRVRVVRDRPESAQSKTAAAPSAAASEPAAADPATHAGHPGAVTSPMVGTAYLAADPDADPFVAPGDTVTEGQTLLIVEAMKTMNPIPAPRGGKLTQVLVGNGAPVEYGEVLMIIE